MRSTRFKFRYWQHWTHNEAFSHAGKYNFKDIWPHVFAKYVLKQNRRDVEKKQLPGYSWQSVTVIWRKLNLCIFCDICTASVTPVGTEYWFFFQGMSKVKNSTAPFLNNWLHLSNSKTWKCLWHLKSFNVFIAAIKSLQVLQLQQFWKQ